MYPPQGNAGFLERYLRALRAIEDLAGSIFYVKTDGDDTRDGTTWANAVKTIDHAVGLCTAAKNDIIFVKQGTYDENAHTTLGVNCDVKGITIIGVGPVTVNNTDTTNAGSCFTITADNITLTNIQVMKGETTSANAVLILIAACDSAKLKGVQVILDDDDTFTGVKITSTCKYLEVGAYGETLSEIIGVYSKSTGIYYDGTGMDMLGVSFSGFTTGLSLGGNAKWLGISRDSTIDRCTTGILIAAGANNNVFNMSMSSNTTDITDNSGVATNDYHSSVAYIHHEMRHVPKTSGVTYYVDGAGGKDTNCGCNPKESFATIAVALAALSSGDRVVVMSKPGKYEETGLTMSKKGTELIFEPGAILKEDAGGDALTVAVAGSDCKLTNVYIDNDNAGGKCFVINGESCQVTGCVAIQGTIGFEVDSDLVFFKSCVATDNSVTQFDISSKYGRYQSCIANGDGQAVRGFYLSDNTADLNTFVSCSSLGNTTAGWEYVAGADENLCTLCSTGGGDGAKVDNGTNNTCANCGEGSQIVTGQSRDQDLRDIYTQTEAKVAGEAQISATTIDLDQAAGAKDLFIGTTQDVLLESLTIRLPNVDVSDDTNITSISVQTDDVTAQELISATAGAKANLTAEVQLSWGAGPFIIKTGTKIQLTIAGGAADAETVCDVVAKCRAIVSGGYLA